MNVSLSTVLAVAALAASVVLLVQSQSRAWAIAAAVASGIMVAAAFGLLTFSIAGVSLSVVLGGVLVVAGAFLYGKESRKLRVACSTVVAVVGAIVLVQGLGLL